MSAAVVMDGVEIPERLIAEEVQNHPAGTAAQARTAALKALAVKALLLNRARELGLVAAPQVLADGREETAEEALITALLDREVDAPVPSEAECRRFYGAQAERFACPALYEASHILFEAKSDEPDAWRTAYASASWALEVYREGLTSFEAMAKALSDCPSGEVGGSLGQLSAGDLAAEVEAALEALAPGEAAGEPVRSRFGWHLVRLDRRMPAQTPPYEAVRDKIRLHLQSRAWTAAAARYVAQLSERAREGGVVLAFGDDGALGRPVVSLGDLLADYAMAARLEPWLASVDPDLAGRVAQVAAAQHASVPDFVRSAVGEFIHGADDQAWTRLVSAARDADDPALASLAAILKSKLAPRRRSITLIDRR
jgi:peptidyl-prolyl cis-trans isomerase C